MAGMIGFRGWPALLMLALAASLLAACDAEVPTEPVDVVRPALIERVGEAALSSDLRFPGRVRAVTRAELSFNVAGELLELPVSEGQRVRAGDLIARIDPEQFELRLAAARAEFDKARTDYERYAEIFERSQAVPRAEVDQRRTAMEVARSSFAAARRDVEDSALRAPFDGVIARRFVENFQQIQAKEPIVSLQDLAELEIVIHVPERIVQRNARRVAGWAVFESLPGLRLPVTLKSFSAEADPQTQTYEVVLSLVRPPETNILPGMSAEILPDHAAGPAETQVSLSIPVNAIFAATDGSPQVWVVDPDTARVSRRAIRVARLTETAAIVESGLVPGEDIVVAGVSHLRDDMRVRPL